MSTFEFFLQGLAVAAKPMNMLYALIVVSPFALVAGLLWLWRRRSVERLLAGAGGRI